MKKLFRYLWCGPADRADELAQLAAVGVLVFFGLSIWSICVKGEHFDAASYGVGLGAVIAAAGAGMFFRNRPGPPPPPS